MKELNLKSVDGADVTVTVKRIGYVHMQDILLENVPEGEVDRKSGVKLQRALVLAASTVTPGQLRDLDKESFELLSDAVSDLNKLGDDAKN